MCFILDFWVLIIVLYVLRSLHMTTGELTEENQVSSPGDLRK